MKLSWLLPLLLGGGAVPSLGAAEIAGDTVLSAESQVLLGKGMSYTSKNVDSENLGN
jgi:hypothetical protein